MKTKQRGFHSTTPKDKQAYNEMAHLTGSLYHRHIVGASQIVIYSYIKYQQVVITKPASILSSYVLTHNQHSPHLECSL